VSLVFILEDFFEKYVLCNTNFFACFYVEAMIITPSLNETPKIIYRNTEGTILFTHTYPDQIRLVLPER
jgi:hypothetical protein